MANHYIFCWLLVVKCAFVSGRAPPQHACQCFMTLSCSQLRWCGQGQGMWPVSALCSVRVCICW